jgi:hypothetical protein
LLLSFVKLDRFTEGADASIKGSYPDYGSVLEQEETEAAGDENAR